MTSANRLHPALRPNPSVRPSPIDEDARGQVLDHWVRLWATDDELVLLASSPGEARSLNLLARDALRRAGRLTGPTVAAGDLALCPGDRVVTGPEGTGPGSYATLGEGCPGDVRLTDPARGTAVIDYPTAGAVRLSAAQLQRAGLRYGYAIPAPPGRGRRIAGVRLARPVDLGAEIA